MVHLVHLIVVVFVASVGIGYVTQHDHAILTQHQHLCESLHLTFLINININITSSEKCTSLQRGQSLSYFSPSSPANTTHPQSSIYLPQSTLDKTQSCTSTFPTVQRRNVNTSTWRSMLGLGQRMSRRMILHRMILLYIVSIPIHLLIHLLIHSYQQAS